ncbi:aminotransferase class V-fold PLP-dependent enzyme [Boudabousia marimammalium]|uniref:Cysteine desulfurase n=1 Tax=Boudabousia marimammalium TaxID=156892 RepID=A0A1Q5PRK4_9ACTO|nr:SufS family cysteine desulfurase [Boudabousia marimammalium]OKL50072.1 cysteine desulfurase [Boudabousia marimammalium]
MSEVSVGLGSGFTALELEQLRGQFPILSRTGRGGRPIAYLDSAATSQKPQSVISAVSDYYANNNAAVNRGTHLLADESTVAFEQARKRLADFVGADVEEIIWTKNATEGLNLLAFVCSAGVGKASPWTLGPGDEVCSTVVEHHANIVPWQQACQRSGAKFTWLDATEDGLIDTSRLAEKINSSTKIVAITHASNVTGAITDLEPIIAAARRVGALVVLDTCQSSAHLPINLHDLGVDAAVFSAHKMMGPTGIGALYVRAEVLEHLAPFLTGGSMVTWVTMEEATFHEAPAKFEAGTQPVAQAVGWAKALDFYDEVGFGRIEKHERAIGEHLLDQLKAIKQVRILGPKSMDSRLAVVSFEVEGVHPHDVGQILDDEDVAVRVGHHCAIPLHTHFGVRSSTRASASLTTSVTETDRLVAGINRVIRFFGG